MSAGKFNMEEYLKLRDLDADLRKREKLRKKKKESSRKIRIFLKVFALLVAVLIINSLYKALILNDSVEVEAEIIAVNNQSFTLPLDGGVNTFIIKYEYEIPTGAIIDVNEISASELKDYFKKMPVVGDLISIEYAKNDPEVSRIIKGNW